MSDVSLIGFLQFPEPLDIRIGQGWLYLTTVIDLFDTKVIGWLLSETMKAQDTSLAALKMAKLHCPLQDQDSLIFYSHRGIQYACTEFTSIVEKHIPRSMSGIAKHITNTKIKYKIMSKRKLL